MMKQIISLGGVGLIFLLLSNCKIQTTVMHTKDVSGCNITSHKDTTELKAAIVNSKHKNFLLDEFNKTSYFYHYKNKNIVIPLTEKDWTYPPCIFFGGGKKLSINDNALTLVSEDITVMNCSGKDYIVYRVGSNDGGLTSSDGYHTGSMQKTPFLLKPGESFKYKLYCNIRSLCCHKTNNFQFLDKKNSQEIRILYAVYCYE